MIMRDAPRAIVDGQFEVNKHWTVYGLPARLIGLVLLLIPSLILVEIAFLFGVRHGWEKPDWYILVWLVLFIGAIIVAAFLCVVFREKRREETIGRQPHRDGD